MKGSLQLIKYAGVGGAAAVVEWTSFAFVVGVIHLFYLTGVIISFITATATNYLLCSRFVFARGRHAPLKEIFLLYMVSAIGLLLNLLFMSLFVGFVGIRAMPAKIMSTGLVFFWNFGARRTWIFAK